MRSNQTRTHDLADTYRTGHFNRFGKYALNPHRIPDPLDFEIAVPLAA